MNKTLYTIDQEISLNLSWASYWQTIATIKDIPEENINEETINTQKSNIVSALKTCRHHLNRVRELIDYKKIIIDKINDVGENKDKSIIDPRF